MDASCLHGPHVDTWGICGEFESTYLNAGAAFCWLTIRVVLK